jgi:hypothetical protein
MFVAFLRHRTVMDDPIDLGMPAYREIFLEKDEPPVVQPSLEDLLRPETEEEKETLSLADFDDEQ